MELYLFLLSICIMQINLSDSSKRTYQLIFPHHLNDSYAKLDGSINEQLSEFTLCQWIKKSNANIASDSFAYAVDEPSNDYIFIHMNPNLGFHFGHNHIQSSGWLKHDVDDWKWIHFCGTWTKFKGMWQIFINGVRTYTGRDMIPTVAVIPNGIVILGKRVWKISQEYDQLYPFEGNMSELNMWNFVLSPTDISKVYACTFEKEGNVISWRRAKWFLYNGVRISTVELPCGQYNE